MDLIYILIFSAILGVIAGIVKTIVDSRNAKASRARYHPTVKPQNTPATTSVVKSITVTEPHPSSRDKQPFSIGNIYTSFFDPSRITELNKDILKSIILKNIDVFRSGQSDSVNYIFDKIDEIAKIAYMADRILSHYLYSKGTFSRWVKESNKIETFFHNHDDLRNTLEKLIDFEPYFDFYDPKPSAELKLIENDDYVMQFLPRWSESVIASIAHLKTEKSRQSKLNDQIKHMEYELKLRSMTNALDYLYTMPVFTLINEGVNDEILSARGIPLNDENKDYFNPFTHPDIKAHIQSIDLSPLNNEYANATVSTLDILHMKDDRYYQLLDEYRHNQDKHFDNITAMEDLYRRRGDISCLKQCIDVCVKDILFLPELDYWYRAEQQVSIDFHRQLDSEILDTELNGVKYGFDGNIQAFERLAIICTKSGVYNIAIEVCDRAVEHYRLHNRDDETGAFKKRKVKLEKRLITQ